MPPRESTTADTLRFYASVAGLLTLLVVSATGAVPLITITMLLVYALVGLQCLTLEQE